jgi:hypothetical protein
VGAYIRKEGGFVSFVLKRENIHSIQHLEFWTTRNDEETILGKFGNRVALQRNLNEFRSFQEACSRKEMRGGKKKGTNKISRRSGGSTGRNSK